MARVSKNSSLSQLQAENKRLQAENAELKQETTRMRQQTTTKRHHFWKHVGLVVCVALAGALLVAGNILFWAGNTIVNTDKFIATTSPIIKQPDVQKGVALYATNKIYENVNVEQTIQDALPPRADFLAPSLSGQVKTLTQTSFEKVLANQKFQDAWIDTLTNAHARLINYVENYQGDGTISLNDLYNRLSQNLQNTKLSFLANKTLPSKVGTITIVQAGWLPEAHNLVTNIGLYQGLTTLAFLLLSAAAVWLVRNRRKMVIALGLTYSFLMVVTLVAVRIAIHSIAGSVDSAYQAAVQTAATSVMHGLIMQSRTILALGLLTVVVAWVTGPARAAVASRNRLNMLLEGKLHGALFNTENRFTRWTGAHKRVLQWASLVIIAAIMLFVVELTPALVLIYALVLLALILVVELLAAPTA